ncbi:Uma2 family endonuclease [Nocardia cyriacigeorgica]|uniref:Uma2 family endonuclease n=1 Tax=Nocardia cyriacigeorgica TaxID=135487 RepID=UPI001E302004|nr:Uma2 family endonuclease [Nocardia cyriacigeorgica]
MSSPRIQRPDLPGYMTWDELEQLPAEIAEQIELWEGRVIWLPRGPHEHQEFANLMWSALRRCAREAKGPDPAQRWRVSTGTNVFLGGSEKSDFVTPDFLVHRHLSEPYQDLCATDVLLAGEVLDPSDNPADVEPKKARYAGAGIPWYWEVTLPHEERAVAWVHAYALESTHGKLPEGVRPLHPANYLLTGNWSPKDSDAIVAEHPFPIRIPWSELEF